MGRWQTPITQAEKQTLLPTGARAAPGEPQHHGPGLTPTPWAKEGQVLERFETGELATGGTRGSKPAPGETMASAERSVCVFLRLCMRQWEMVGSKGQRLGGQCPRPVIGGIRIVYMYHGRSHLALGNLFRAPEWLLFSWFSSPVSHSPTAVTRWSSLRLKSIIFQFPRTILTTNAWSSAAGPHPVVRAHSEISHQWHKVPLDYFLVVGLSWSSQNCLPQLVWSKENYKQQTQNNSLQPSI